MQCSNELRSRIEANLKSLDVINGDENGAFTGKSAAVALIVVELGYGADLKDLPQYRNWQNDAAILLTRRALTLRLHPGQWALPGGRIDTEEDAISAARREAKEEIDLDLPSTSLMGRLDDFVTRSGFLMRPLVFWGGKATNLHANPDEVASIHRIPVSELMREDAPILNHDEICNDASANDEPGSPVLRMPVGQSWIAAPTAAILYQFREVAILGKATRVAHFEQPEFAWK